MRDVFFHWGLLKKDTMIGETFEKVSPIPFKTFTTIYKIGEVGMFLPRSFIRAPNFFLSTQPEQ